MRAAVLIEGASAGRLEEQLRALGIDEVRVVAPAFSAIAAAVRAAPAGDLVLASGDVFTQGEALAGVLADPRLGTAVLSSRQDRGPGSFPLRSERGRVLSAASGFHTIGAPTEWFLGVIKVRADDRTALLAAVDELAALDLGGDPIALLLVGLVRSGVHVGQSDLRALFWARPAGAAALEQAQRDVEGHDEERVLLDSSVKAIDGFFTTFFVSPYSKYIARWCARRGLTPNQVTSFSMLLGVVAAVGFATGERWGLVAGAVLLQLAFTFDCVDGQLARFTRTFTPLGAWLDSTFDRGKEWAVYAGLAIGAAHAGDPVWTLAGAALTLQVVRHGFDFAFAATEHQNFTTVSQLPLDQAFDGTPDHRVDTSRAPSPSTVHSTAAGGAAGVLRRWRRIDKVPGLIWIKRMVVFPIGERFAAISLTAALWDARTTFVVLLAWGVVAALYGLAGRVLRSLR
ncbi:MAG: CDP-alcohol phosphatidyltransferase family protein [Solirubrobacteraceae bacterium]